ncbi:MAG: MBL fold metallo-hydrolase [Chitinophagaceae bacterium]|nr:MBL fold metallo-hydrolase [Chitinophagaceae bacterium]
MDEIRQSADNKFIPMTSVDSGKGMDVTADVYYFTQQIVNVIFLENAEADTWVLIDAGMPYGGQKIIDMAEKKFGSKPPAAILLTHGHFDHVGGIKKLLEKWDVPVFAHRDEFPFLTGKQAYSEPDTSVEGGVLAKISSLYPNEPVDISVNLYELPVDGSVPLLPAWQWVHTPGHSPGQVAFFRQADRILISGDAIITVRQDSLYRVLIQKEEVCGPPVYLTTDWDAAEDSVRKLAALNPEWMIGGHGQAMHGLQLRDELDKLVANFREVAVPSHGKWV